MAKVDRVEFAVVKGVQVRYCPLRNLYWPFPVSPAGQTMKIAWHAIDTYNVSMARTVGGLLDEIRPDVVNTHNIAGFSVAIWKAIGQRGLPLVHTLHDHYLLCPYSTMFRNGKNCARQCLRCRMGSISRRAMTYHVDGVLGVSRFILERHLGHGFCPDTRATVVYSGYRRPTRLPAVRTRASGDSLRIGFLGGLHPIKGLDRLVEAFLCLPPRKAELWIAGAGDPRYEASLKSRTASRDDVRWFGVVRPEAFLPELDILVVPSLVNEAMGRVVVEAFSYGVPVIGASRGGIPELFHAECGWLFDPDENGRLLTILKQILERRGELDAMRTVVKTEALRFSYEVMVAGYLAAYHDARTRRSQR